jgi:hypothetical protein
MKPAVLLYPQSLFYPPKLLKSTDFVSEIFVVELLKTKERIQKNFPQLLSKVRFLKLAGELHLSKEVLAKVLEDAQNLALYLRTPDALRLYHLHKSLFEESYPLFSKKETFNSPLERAYLLLSIAEELDENLLEVALSLKSFMHRWQDFFEEKILFKDETLEDFSETSGSQEMEFEELWEQEKRIFALKVILPLLNWQEARELNTLLVSEAGLLEELEEGEELSESIELASGIFLKRFKGVLNSKIGLPESEGYPLFQQILFIL